MLGKCSEQRVQSLVVLLEPIETVKSGGVSGGGMPARADLCGHNAVSCFSKRGELIA